MANFAARSLEMVDADRHVEPGYFGGVAPYASEAGAHAMGQMVPAAWARNANRAARAGRNFGSILLPSGPERDWFEHIFVVPTAIEAGFILGVETYTLSIYNAYRTARSLDAFVNGAGAGITFPDLPTLPESIPAQSGFDVTVVISEVGPAVIDGDLTFEFDTVTIDIPVTGQRTIVLAHEPETPLEETLVWFTDVLEGRGGTEQRVSLRHTPRSRWALTFAVHGDERRRLEMEIFDGEARVFGVPIWYEPSHLAVTAEVDDLTVSIDSTEFSSFVAGGLALLFRAHDYFEILTVESVTDTTITFTSPLTKEFSIGERVLPVRLGLITSGQAPGRRGPLDWRELSLVLTSIDNEQDLADVSTWPTFDGKVLVDDPNIIEDFLPESLNRRVTVFDSGSGKFEMFSEWIASRRVSGKTWLTQTREDLWRIRQLLHALRGQQVSFYLPTFYADMAPAGGVTSGGTTLTIENIGYARFSGVRQPRNVVRLGFSDGSQVVREIVSANEIDDDTEQITVASAWGVDWPQADIIRIDFVEKVRLAADEAKIRHLDALGQAMIRIPVISVSE